MKKTFKQKSGMLKAAPVLCAVMALFMTVCVASCDNDEPGDGGGDQSVAGIVTADELAGEWTLVQNKVLYSEVNPSKQDEVISYSANSTPRYRFYKVSVTDEDVISIVEVSASGSVVGTAMQLEMEGDNLIASDGNVAGTVTHYNKSHSWENLKIKWNKDYSPMPFNAPVISTYML